MHAAFEESAPSSILLRELNAITAKIVGQVAPRVEGRLLSASANIGGAISELEGLVVLREGTVLLCVEEQTIFYFEAGDVLWPELVGLPGGSYRAEFAVRVDVLPAHEVCVLPQWGDYSALRLQAVARLLGEQIRGEQQVSPSFERFEAGTVLIEQGDSGTQVYTLVEGSARVYVDSIEVGEITEGEIFGALAALTGTKRTARIVASSSCLVMSLPKERFLELIMERPVTVCKLVEDMAAAIVRLNQRVVTLSGGTMSKDSKLS